MKGGEGLDTQLSLWGFSGGEESQTKIESRMHSLISQCWQRNPRMCRGNIPPKNTCFQSGSFSTILKDGQ